MNIVFMGTPDFAVKSLEKVIADGHNVQAVYTKADAPKGRKMVLTPSDVKVCALEHNLIVYTPATFKDETEVERLKALNPDLIVVVAYGKLLPKSVLDIPKYGCVNVHGSILPKWRGAAPIQWTVLSGDEYGGVTTMYMNEGLDTGDIIFKKEVKVGENETSGELFDRLCVDGAELLSETIKAIEAGTAPRIPQDDNDATYATMLSKEISEIDWNKTANDVHNKVRGLSPWPSAQSKLFGKRIKILETRVSDKFGEAGRVVSVNPLTIACSEGSVEILRLQPEGKRAMSSADYLMGHPLEIGTVFGE
ncbi:MAG: methionyl-tRNA formyltransferase [Ruminococcus sp.]|nr:methionyl-tRNA formyltransferase [Ruminococcus sp.]